jgi:hypothetical protein
MSEKGKETNKKPELSNRPVPKDSPKSSFVRKVIVLVSVAVFIFAGVTMKMHASTTGRMPWSWDGSDWKNYLTAAKETAKDTTSTLSEKVKSIDWDKVKTKITEKTKKLWNKLTKMEEKIAAKLKTEETKRAAKVAKNSEGAKGSAKGPVVKSNYEKALEAMRDAVVHYRNSVSSQKALKSAKVKFQLAQSLFEKSLKDVADGQKPEVESMLQECNQYVYDCLKREKL